MEHENLNNQESAQLGIGAVSGSFYEIKIHKSDSEIINEYLFEPTIYRYKEVSVVHDYLNFPHNWRSWHLPKKLHKKDLKIRKCHS
jgi:hypothetical protein